MAQKYFDESGDKKYFTIIPNFITNHSTANDQSLYLQMKRIAGDGGICEAGYRYFIKQMKIGYKAYQKSKKYLLSKKWITYIGKKKVLTKQGEQIVDCYKVNDIWKLNNEHYQGGAERNHLKDEVVLKENEVVSKANEVVLKESIRRTRKIKKDKEDDKLEFSELLKKYPNFNSFYSAYPKKKDGRTALKAFQKLSPSPSLEKGQRTIYSISSNLSQ